MMRHPIFNRYWKNLAIVGGVLFLGLQLFAACAGDPSNNAMAPESENLSAAFTIRWHGAPQMQAANRIGVMADLNCEAAGVEEVFCNVYDENDNLLATGGPWRCTDGNGTVTGIKAGRNRTFVALAEDRYGNVIYRGETSGIRIRQDITEEVVVDAYPFMPPGLDTPGEQDTVDPAGFTFQWIAAGDDRHNNSADHHKIQVAESRDFDNPAIDDFSYDYTYPARNLRPSMEYFWRVQPFDRFLNPGRWSEVGSFYTSNCTYTIDPPTNTTIGQEGGDGQFNVNASSRDCQWVAASEDDWIQFTDGSEAGVGDDTVFYHVEANTTPTERVGSITLGEQAHTITQDGLACDYQILQPTGEFDEGGGEGGFDVIATPSDCPWSVSTDADWIEITSGETGSGNDTVTYTVLPNGTGAPRDDVITVGGAQHQVYQSAPAAVCTYDVVPSQFSFDEWGGSTNQNCSGGICTIMITTQADCEVSATPNAAWITVGTPISEAGEIWNVTFEVAENTDTTRRDAEISISGEASCLIAQRRQRSTIEEGIDLYSETTSSIRENVPDHFTCLELCFADTPCRTWVYVSGTNVCYLKNADIDTTPIPDEDTISGVIYGR